MVEAEDGDRVRRQPESTVVTREVIWKKSWEGRAKKGGRTMGLADAEVA